MSSTTHDQMLYPPVVPITLPYSQLVNVATDCISECCPSFGFWSLRVSSITYCSYVGILKVKGDLVPLTFLFYLTAPQAPP